MSKITLYGNALSPPVRACLLTLNALEQPFEFKIIHLAKLEQLEPEFLKHNPQHTIPVLEDNGAWLWDSHAICAYLVSKYGKDDDSLYPKDLLKRAIVDQRMYFDASILFMALRHVSAPLFRQNITVVTKDKTDNITEGYEFVEKFLADNEFITGHKLNIADFCCCATITTLNGVLEIDEKKYPKLKNWLARLTKLPYFEEANEKGNKGYVDLLKSKITQIIV